MTATPFHPESDECICFCKQIHLFIVFLYFPFLVGILCLSGNYFYLLQLQLPSTLNPCICFCIIVFLYFPFKWAFCICQGIIFVCCNSGSAPPWIQFDKRARTAMIEYQSQEENLLLQILIPFI